MIAHHDRVPSRRAPFFLVIISGGLMLALLLTTASRPAGAQELEPENPPPDVAERIVRVAMSYVGQHGGQCFVFVRQVIAEATGISMGFGYHQGFLEGGAVEVPLSEARRGDVIQIADPNNNGPGVDYPGLHTVIVVNRNDDGTFGVVDSNAQWDEMVRSRDGYDPAASAARYPNLAARAYRFSHIEPGTQFSVASATPLQSTSVITPGDQARVATDTGGCLNLRPEPTTSVDRLRCLANGLFLTVLDGTAEADGYVWRQVQAGEDVGWVVEVFLQGVVSGEAPPPETDETDSAAEVVEQGATIGQILSGGLPATGGVALLVWGGGSVDALHTIASDGGCNLLSIWSTADGGLVGHIIGAPEFVNASWVEHFPGDLPESTPLLAVCARPSDDGGNTPTSPPDGEFIEGEGPPGPAGNE